MFLSRCDKVAELSDSIILPSRMPTRDTNETIKDIYGIEVSATMVII